MKLLCYYPLMENFYKNYLNLTKLIIHHAAGDRYSKIEYEPVEKIHETNFEENASYLLLYFETPIIEWDKNILILLFRIFIQKRNSSFYIFGPLSNILANRVKNIYIPKLVNPLDIEKKNFLFEELTYSKLKLYGKEMLDLLLRNEVHKFSSAFHESSHREATRLVFSSWLTGLIDIKKAYEIIIQAYDKEKFNEENMLAFIDFERLEILRAYVFSEYNIIIQKNIFSKIVLIDEKYEKSGFNLIFPQICNSFGCEIIHCINFESYLQKVNRKELDENSIIFFFLDLRFNNRFEGFNYLYKLRNMHLCIPIVIFTLYEDLHLAMTAFELGANDFLPKTMRDPEKRVIMKSFKSFENIILKYKNKNNAIIRKIWITLYNITATIKYRLSLNDISDCEKSVLKLINDEKLIFYLFYGFWNILLYQDFQEDINTDQLHLIYIQNIQTQFRITIILQLILTQSSKENSFNSKKGIENAKKIIDRFKLFLTKHEINIFEKLYMAGIGSKHFQWQSKSKPSFNDILQNMIILIKMYLFFFNDLNVVLLSKTYDKNINIENNENNIIPSYFSSQAEEYSQLSGFKMYPHVKRSEDAAERFLNVINDKINLQKFENISDLIFLSPTSSKWYNVFTFLTRQNPKTNIVTSNLDTIPDNIFSAVILDFSFFDSSIDMNLFNKFYKIFRFTPVIVLSASSSLNERSLLIQQVGTYFFPKDPDIFEESEKKEYVTSFFSLLSRCKKNYNVNENKLWDYIRNLWYNINFFNHQKWKKEFGSISNKESNDLIENMILEIESFFYTMEMSLCTRFYHRKMNYHNLYYNLFDKQSEYASFYISAGKVAEASLKYLWNIAGKKQSNKNGGIKEIFNLSSNFNELKKSCSNLWDCRNNYYHIEKTYDKNQSKHFSDQWKNLSRFCNLPKANDIAQIQYLIKDIEILLKKLPFQKG